ncbi:DUF7282 domain-containing protein [Halomicrococcus sp. NG-SE-24]|uniref:DUF7282 domain-containing protein n=1 Tax=Halomicrococcus sp. NG-SE-24 TaxID=3436928 RepID=UPI003D990BB9
MRTAVLLVLVALFPVGVAGHAPDAFSPSACDKDARVTVQNQSVTNGAGAATVTDATLETGGFVVLTPDPDASAGEMRVVGVSSYLPPGTHANLTVGLDAPLDRPRRLSAVVLEDASGDRIADFDGSDEFAHDGCGGRVVDAATLRPVCGRAD